MNPRRSCPLTRFRGVLLRPLGHSTAGQTTLAALLRREGLFSSHLTTWRRERKAGVLQALTPHKRGPKSKHHPLAEENQKLQRDNQRLTEQLRKAEIIIDVQKKVAALLGHPIVDPDPETKS